MLPILEPRRHITLQSRIEPRRRCPLLSKTGSEVCNYRVLSERAHDSDRGSSQPLKRSLPVVAPCQTSTHPHSLKPLTSSSWTTPLPFVSSRPSSYTYTPLPPDVRARTHGGQVLWANIFMVTRVQGRGEWAPGQSSSGTSRLSLAWRHSRAGRHSFLVNETVRHRCLSWESRRPGQVKSVPCLTASHINVGIPPPSASCCIGLHSRQRLISLHQPFWTCVYPPIQSFHLSHHRDEITSSSSTTRQIPPQHPRPPCATTSTYACPPYFFPFFLEPSILDRNARPDEC